MSSSSSSSSLELLLKIEDSLVEIRSRRERLIQLLHLVDRKREIPAPITDEEEDSPPALESFFQSADTSCVDFPHSVPQSVSNRSVVSRSSHNKSVVSVDCSFTPTISRKSREIAAKMGTFEQRLNRAGGSKSAAAVLEASTSDDKRGTKSTEMTEALVARIKKVYGSLEEYHKRRRENTPVTALSLRDKEMKECTFKPVITQRPPGDASLLSEKSFAELKVEGIDSFLKRQEKARELKREETGQVKRPGCGALYTGKPTKVTPFSFIDRQTVIRTYLRE